MMSDLFDYDAELRLHNELFRAAARVSSHDRVLDIGCGTGQSTRDAARAAVNGNATGVDISEPTRAPRSSQLVADRHRRKSVRRGVRAHHGGAISAPPWSQRGGQWPSGGAVSSACRTV